MQIERESSSRGLTITSPATRFKTMNNSVGKWFGGHLGNLSKEQAQAAATLADELLPSYLPGDFHIAMLEALDELGLEY